MLTIYLNDEKITLSGSEQMLDVVLSEKGVHGHFAIAINRQFIPRSSWAATELRDGDQIDVVTPMQGG